MSIATEKIMLLLEQRAAEQGIYIYDFIELWLSHTEKEEKMSDDTFINMDLGDDDATEPGTHPEGQVDLRVFSANKKTSKNNPEREMIELAIQIEAGDGAEYAPIFEYVLFPTATEIADANSGDSKAAANVSRFKRDTVKYCQIFSVPIENGGFSVLDFNGATGTCLIGIESYEGNTSNKLKLPRLPKRF